MNKVMIRGMIRTKDGAMKGHVVCDTNDGITVVFGPGNNEDFVGTVYEYPDDFIIEAGDFNAHSHPEQSIYTDIVDKEWDLGTWCRNTIYKYSPLLKPEHVYLGCSRAFSRMLSLGVTSAMVSFYCHNNNGNCYDRQVIKAACDTGIRLYFGRMNYDIVNEDAYEGKRNSQKCYYESFAEAAENYMELLNKTKAPTVEVAPAIHSIHASTRTAIANAINLGNRYGKKVQFHLSEDKGDVDLSLKLHGCRPIKFLSSLVEHGEVETLKNVILSDCVWIDDEERQLIKKHEMSVVLNPRMNHRIKTGEADLQKLLQSGIRPYLGTDGEASNDDLSISGERNFLKKRFPMVSVKTIDNLGKEDFPFKKSFIGEIKTGNFCDLKITRNGKVEDVFVGGKRVVRQGKLTTVDVENDMELPLKKLMNKTVF